MYGIHAEINVAVLLPIISFELIILSHPDYLNYLINPSLSEKYDHAIYAISRRV